MSDPTPTKASGTIDIGDNLAVVLQAGSCEAALNQADTSQLCKNLEGPVREVLTAGAQPKCVVCSFGLGHSSTNSIIHPPERDEGTSAWTSISNALSQLGSSFGLEARVGAVHLSNSAPRLNVFCLGVTSLDQIPTQPLGSKPSTNEPSEEIGSNKSSESRDKIPNIALGPVAEIAELRKALPSLLAQLGIPLSKPAIAVQTSASPATRIDANSDASVIRFQENGVEKVLCLAVAGSTDFDLDRLPRVRLTIAEAARRLACCGSQILGASVSLTMDSSSAEPERLQKALGEVASICGVFNAPVISSYARVQDVVADADEALNLAVALVGAVPPVEAIPSQKFKAEGDVIILLGQLWDINDSLQGLGGSVYLEQVLEIGNANPPSLNAEYERELHLALRALIYSGEINSAHSCGRGGLAVALAECCLLPDIGQEVPVALGAHIDLAHLFGSSDSPEATHNAMNQDAGSGDPAYNDSVGRVPPRGGTVDLVHNQSPSPPPNVRLDALLFGEIPGRAVITTRPENAVKVQARARLLGVPALRIGTVGGTALEIKTLGAEMVWALTELVGRQD